MQVYLVQLHSIVVTQAIYNVAILSASLAHRTLGPPLVKREVQCVDFRIDRPNARPPLTAARTRR